MEYIKLNNGIEIPVLGYGIFQVSPEECERCVTDVLKQLFNYGKQPVSFLD